MSEPGWRLRREGGVVWLCFDGWDGIRCLHSTRVGGVSSPPFKSLNLSHSVGDLEENVAENRQRFGALTGIDPSKVVFTRQVHSDKVNLVQQPGEDYEGDALLCDQREIPLAVSVADCLPIYLHDRSRGAFGLVHAGRRGTLKGIAAKAILKMEHAFGTKPDECSVLFGPAIGPCCYQVSPELASEFEGRFPGCTVEGPTKITRRGYPPAGEQVGEAGQDSPTRLEREESKTHLDLWRANELELRKIGVRDIVGTALCTSCREDLFFSHRRDGGRTGRMLAVLMRVWWTGRALTGRPS